MKRRISLIGVAVACLAAMWILVGLTDADGATTPEAPAADKTSTATATTRTLTESVTVDGVVGYGTSRALPIASQGLVTEAPESGDVLEPGDTAVRIGDSPVTLIEGDMPLHRNLEVSEPGAVDEAGNAVKDPQGIDVEQVQQFLIDHGFDGVADNQYGADTRLSEVDGIYGPATRDAVKEWQRSVGLAPTGIIDRTQMIAIAGPVRVESVSAVGVSFTSLVVSDVEVTLEATVQPAERSAFAVGRLVDVIIAGTTQLQAKVTETTRVTQPDGSVGYRVEAEPVTPLPDGVESVELQSIEPIVENAITVPVTALIALEGGGWAVETVVDSTIVLKTVQLGVVVDAVAEVTGIEDGTVVVVPS